MTQKRKNKEVVANHSSDNANENVLPFKSGTTTKFKTSTVELAMSLREARKRIEALNKFIEDIMIPGIDYGYIPGIDRPALLKPGAEKLSDAFQFSNQIEVIKRVEDWNRGLFHYEVITTLLNKETGEIVCQGIGSCNSREGRFYNQRGFDIANTVLKLAKKRGFIDAVLTATRSSDLFTQDVEEMSWLWKGKKEKATSPDSTKSEVTVSYKLLAQLFSLVALKKIPVDEVKEAMNDRYQVTDSRKLTVYQAEDFLKYLKQYEKLPTKACK